MKLEEGKIYLDRLNNRVEFRYMGKTGFAIVCEPGDSGGGMQSCWAVKSESLRNLSWVELTDEELQEIVLGECVEKRDRNSKFMALDEIKRRSHEEGYDKGRNYKPDDVMLEKLLNACGFVRAGSKTNG